MIRFADGVPETPAPSDLPPGRSARAGGYLLDLPQPSL
jgi:hypothetical protein